MPIKNAIHSQQVYDPTDESIMAEQELCMERYWNSSRWRQLELNSIANPKMSIGITHLIKQELEPSA